MAYWQASGMGTGTSTTGTLLPPTNVQVPSTSASAVSVGWTASGGDLAPVGYYVTRTSGAGSVAACGSSPTSLVSSSNCVDHGVADGGYTYTVTAVNHSWSAVSQSSGSVSVASATQLSFSANPGTSVAGGILTPAPTVVLLTVSGTPVHSSGTPITVRIGNNPGNGSLSGTVSVTTDANGSATFGDLSIGIAGVGYTLTASSPSLSGAAGSSFTVSSSHNIDPGLGTAASYSALGTSATNSGSTTISGDVGLTNAASSSGFPPGAIQGETHIGDSAAATAQSDRATAYANAHARTSDSEFTGDLAGATFYPGTYHTGAAFALSLSGILTLDGKGDANALFIFQVDSALNTGASSTIKLVNGAQASHVYWVVSGSAGIGADSSFSGTILAQGAITVGARGQFFGRALSAGALFFAFDTVRFTAAASPTIAITGGSASSTNSASPAISGTTTALAGRTVAGTFNGQTFFAVVQADQTWAFAAGNTAPGAYTVFVRVRDAAGNATTATQNLIVQSLLPL